MNIKEQIIEKLQSANYDMFTACEEADRIIDDFKNHSMADQCTYWIRGTNKGITLQRAINLQSSL